MTLLLNKLFNFKNIKESQMINNNLMIGFQYKHKADLEIENHNI
jgi:hypothetical protein